LLLFVEVFELLKRNLFRVRHINVAELNSIGEIIIDIFTLRFVGQCKVVGVILLLHPSATGIVQKHSRQDIYEKDSVKIHATAANLNAEQDVEFDLLIQFG
jgi:hypothetical protein